MKKILGYFTKLFNWLTIQNSAKLNIGKDIVKVKPSEEDTIYAGNYLDFIYDGNDNFKNHRT